MLKLRRERKLMTPTLWKGLAIATGAHLIFLCLFKVTFYTKEETGPLLAPVRVEIDMASAPKQSVENPLPALTQIDPHPAPDLPEFPSFVITPLDGQLASHLPEFTGMEKIPYQMYQDDDLR